MDKYPLVSVYTCVYNGQETIDRVFRSMNQLDYPNLEHVIINDGSTDNTAALVKSYIDTASFPVKYLEIKHGGKHIALNRAWGLAEGVFLVQLDADDELLPHSVRFLVDTYYQIPEDIREDYWCVHGRCMTQFNEFVGDKYPDNINTVHWTKALLEARNCKGEKTGLQLKSYLDHFRFPEIVGISYIPEGIIWTQLEARYGTWYTNEIVRVYYTDEGNNLTAQKTKRKQFGPIAYKYKWQLMHPKYCGKTVSTMLRYSLFYFISNQEYRSNNKYLKDLNHVAMPLIMLAPFAFFSSILYRIVKRIR